MKHTWTMIGALALFAGAANADTWYLRTNSPTGDAANWNSQPDGSGTSPTALPTTGDTDTWVFDTDNRAYINVSDYVWEGGTTIIEGLNGRDELYHNGNTLTLQDVELRGGDNPANTGAGGTWNAATLNLDNNNNNKFVGDILTIAGGNTGTLGIERRQGTVAFATYTGSGDLLVSGWDNGHQWLGTGFRGPLTFVDGGSFSTFTGSINLEKVKAGFGYDITTASFDLSITKESEYILANNVAVNTLLVGPDFITAGGGTGTDGAYLYGDFTAAQQAYFDDQGGSIKVTVNGTVTLPEVTQQAAESIDETIASIPGEVTDSGGETPTLTVYYGLADGGTDPNPGTGWTDSKTVGPTFGDFTADLTGLTNNTTYFYRCRVTNSATGPDTDGWAAASGTFTTGTVPDPVYTVQNGNITNSTTWIGSPPVPTSGTSDTKTWQILHTNVDRGIDPATFAGQTLEIGDGVSDDGRLRLEPGSGTLTVRDLVLNPNGTIWQDNDTNTLAGDTLTLTGDGGYIAPDRIDGGSEQLALNFETYTGDGTVYLYGNNANGNNATVFQTTNATPGTAMQGFTGTFHRDRLNGNGGCVRWDFSVTVATFAIKLADTNSALPPATGNGGASDDLTANGKMYLTNGVDVMVTDLHLYDEASDGAVVVDVHLADGTYTLDTGTNPTATDLSNVGGQNYSRFFKGGSGTVTVDSGTTPAADPVIADVRHLGASVELDLEGLDSGATYKVYRDTVLPLSGSKVQVGTDVTGSATATVTDSGPLPVEGYYQAEQQ